MVKTKKSKLKRKGTKKQKRKKKLVTNQELKREDRCGC
jgi:hypothetical protein